MLPKRSPSVYVIFYFEKSYYTTINTQLREKGYDKRIKAIVPTVRILRKVVHGREVYQEVPLLFNYGFMKIPKNLVYSRDFMNKLKRDIYGIRSWLRSPENLFDKKKKRRVDNTDIWDDFSQVGMATKEEVKYFRKLAKENNHFSVEDILSINIGDYIILKGYPYDGIEATVIDINTNKKLVKLQLDLKLGTMEVSLPFDQVLDTVYSNYDVGLVNSSEQLVDMSKVTEETLNKVLDIKQY